MRRQLLMEVVRRVMQKARTMVVSIMSVIVTTLPTVGICMPVDGSAMTDMMFVVWKKERGPRREDGRLEAKIDVVEGR